MNLFGVADTNCTFALTDVEAHGCEKDTSVFSNKFWKSVYFW